jgi:hypothetical protein
VGAFVVAAVACAPGDAMGAPPVVARAPALAAAVAAGGLLGALLESAVVGAAPGIRRCPGWVRNLLPTASGAAIAHVLAEASA